MQVITGLDHHQQWRAALKQLNVADECNISDVQTYSAAMMSCATGEQWQAAVMLLKKSGECFVGDVSRLVELCFKNMPHYEDMQSPTGS